jgi:hypothetical protein
MPRLPFSIIAAALLFAACMAQNQAPAVLSSSGLLRLPYTITDSTVRADLSRAGLGFSVRLRGGGHDFGSALTSFRTVHADAANIVYGDLNHDGVPDAVVPLIIAGGGIQVVELAAVEATGSGAKHFASFPLGRAELRSLDITSGKIRVNFSHTVAGDPGPRNTELLLELPAK